MNRNLSFCLDMLLSALPALLVPIALSALFALVANIGGCASRGKAPDKLSSASHPNLIHGSVFYREKMALPRHAELAIMLYERTPQVGRVLVSEIQSSVKEKNVPFPFTVSAPENPKANTEYELEARISVDGIPLFATPSSIIVPLNSDKPLVIMLQRVIPEESPDGDSISLLTHNRWILRKMKGEPVHLYEDQPEPHLFFTAASQEQHAEKMMEGRITGSDGCNTIFGAYRIKNASIQFLNIGSTMMACLHGEEQAQNFAKSLQEASEWRIAGNDLILLQKGKVLAIFEAVSR